MMDPSAVRRRVFAAAFGVWLVGWLYATRAYLLDDALIHLRFARFLHETGRFTYDGVTPSYGVSSLLYVTLLSVLQAVWNAPGLPKALSVVGYAALVAVLYRRTREVAGVGRDATTMLLVLILGPMAVRWLSDGMETSLVTALACVAALVAGRAAAASRATPGRLGLLAALSALLVFARVEFAMLAVAAAGVEVAVSLERCHATARRRAALLRAASWGLGAAAAAGGIWWRFARIVPDTAIAKAFGYQGALAGLQSVASAHAGALSFGCGLALLWLLTCGRALGCARDRWTRLALVAANASVPAVILAAIVRGQATQGVRYFVPFYVFGTSLTLVLARDVSGEAPATSVPPARWRRPVYAAGVIGLLTVWILEGALVGRIARDRGRMLHDMSRQHLAELSDQVGMASNIGFVGYFTGARICDLSGLVNGRDAARRSPAERLAACWSLPPSFVFLTDGELGALRARLSGWRRCFSYDSTNAFTTERQHLLVAPTLGCPGGSAEAAPSERPPGRVLN